ncbi:MAG: 4-hydroxy-tetrahydrodipicolinate synthase [Candidatus Methanomethylophilaceae archaeon]|jgi:4-hydroxy-tetrahydrodipicolinate synthase|nr:4-hydroxy-tetrahydrodipicolinate synthase [Methanomassiliicoccales archaeon RumEn M2]
MFEGVATALITPFTKSGEVDEECLRRIVRFQEENGVSTLVPCGSTGESATLSHEEHIKVIKIVIDEVKHARVLAGAGSNSTSEAVYLSRTAADLGADGILSISPYCNKPTQEGIFQHYKVVSESVDVPIVIYNVPGRTASNITAETSVRIARELPGVVGIKEASGNLIQIGKILAKKPKDFEVLSGDDAQTFPIIAMGGCGVISVAANCCPNTVCQMMDLCLREKFIDASAIHYRMLPLFTDLFLESNPIPIKYVMKRLGFGNGELRLPLTYISEHGAAVLDSDIEDLGLI